MSREGARSPHGPVLSPVHQRPGACPAQDPGATITPAHHSHVAAVMQPASDHEAGAEAAHSRSQRGGAYFEAAMPRHYARS